MRIIIKTKNIEPTEALNNFIEEKFYVLKKFINILKRENEIGKTLAEVFVELEKETKHHRKGQIFGAKVEVILPGRKLMAQAVGEDLNRTVVKAREELKREINKYKEKMISLGRRRVRQSKKTNSR